MIYDLPEDKTVARFARAVDMKREYARIRASLFAPAPKAIPSPTSRSIAPKPIEKIVATAATVRAIQAFIGQRYQVNVDDLLGDRRTWQIVHLRQIAIYVARRLTGMSSPRVGMLFKRDHTTVLHACQRVEGDEALLAQAEELIGEMIGKDQP